MPEDYPKEFLSQRDTFFKTTPGAEEFPYGQSPFQRAVAQNITQMSSEAFPQMPSIGAPPAPGAPTGGAPKPSGGGQAGGGGWFVDLSGFGGGVQSLPGGPPGGPNYGGYFGAPPTGGGLNFFPPPYVPPQ